MYECPSCGAGVRFDIATQKLACDYCGNSYDPYAFQAPQTDAEERTDAFDVKEFGCPQCGATLITTNTSATEFCAFCGASTILDERLSSELRPGYIIPFEKTREDCMREYARLLRRSLFMPREMRTPEHLNHFVGIYMPYWVYNAKKDGEIRISGESPAGKRRGDYVYYDQYELRGEIHASYEGLSFDASKGFPDPVADAVAPFSAVKMRPFAPAYLCGFYADVADVDGRRYEAGAREVIDADLYRRTVAWGGFTKYRKKEVRPSAMRRQVGVTMEEPRRALYPVWFLSWRKKVDGGEERVAYAVMNGESGKISADLPADTGKYLLGSLLLALPLFFLFELFLTLTPEAALTFAGLASAAVSLIYTLAIREINRREANVLLKGNERYHGNGAEPGGKVLHFFGRRALKVLLILFGIVVAGGGWSLYFVFMFLRAVFQEASSYATPLRAALLLGLAVLIFCYDRLKQYRAGYSLAALFGTLIAALVIFANPVGDIWYYSAAGGIYVFISVTLYGLILKYNRIATRPLPAFHERKRGTGNAQ